MVMPPVCVPVFCAAIPAAFSTLEPPVAVMPPRAWISIKPDVVLVAAMPPSRALIVPGPYCWKVIPALLVRLKALPVGAFTVAALSILTSSSVPLTALSVWVALSVPPHSNMPLPELVSLHPCA